MGFDVKNHMRKLTIGLLIITAVFFTLGTAQGGLYRWVDENGMVHFDETRPDNADSATKVEPLPRHGPGTPGVEGSGTEADKSHGSMRTEPYSGLEPGKTHEGEVELFVTSWCLYCKMAADFLRAKKVPFTSYDIERDKEAAFRKMQLDPSPGVPLAIINGFLIRGFSVEAYEKALAYSEKPGD